jgi:tetratricopeptide (TPR) repeat protein
MESMESTPRHIAVALLSALASLAACAGTPPPAPTAPASAATSPPAAPSTPSLFEAAPVVARAHAHQGKFEEAAAVLRLAIAAAEAQRDVGAQAELHAQLGGIYINRMVFRGDVVAEAPATFRRAQELARASGNRAALGRALDGEGMLLYWRKLQAGEGEWPPIVDRFERALAAREAAQDRRGMAESVFHIGLTEQFRNLNAQAEKTFARALALARETGDPVLTSYPLRHLAYLAEVRGDLEKSLAMHQECVRLREAGGHRTGTIHALIAVGDLMSKIDPRDDAAIATLDRARKLAEELKDATGLRNAEGTLGAIHVRRGAPQQAIAPLGRALALAEAADDRSGVAEFLASLGEAHAALRQRDKAIAHLVRARALAEALDRPELLAAVDRVAREHRLELPPTRTVKR